MERVVPKLSTKWAATELRHTALPGRMYMVYQVRNPSAKRGALHSG
ncbi:hypothetical protein SAMN04490239_3346 [Rhodococcus koreensis]|uniref:Uncharacterized protein n=1 Tax=Rhodococcus koreensis TaxID=99653 RepID=A0A1H4QU89_9NOCA|nr:hypothetical protein SAMN04490239_3346 [Rhodococcus koreensis]